MGHAADMLRTHPLGPERDLEVIAHAIEAAQACADSCRSCADACAAEEQAADLVRCIRLNQDCADICTATAGILSRMAQPDGGLLAAQLDACIAACRACGTECEQHAGMHEHCRVCAEACRGCEAACHELLATFGAPASQWAA